MGKVRPQLEIYELDEINRVLARLAEGKVRHRAVVTHKLKIYCVALSEAAREQGLQLTWVPIAPLNRAP